MDLFEIHQVFKGHFLNELCVSFKDVRFKLEPHVCNKCSIECIFSKSKRIEILNVKGVDYRCILCGISRNKAVNILNNSVLEDKGVIILNNFVLEDRGVL